MSTSIKETQPLVWVTSVGNLWPTRRFPSPSFALRPPASPSGSWDEKILHSFAVVGDGAAPQTVSTLIQPAERSTAQPMAAAPTLESQVTTEKVTTGTLPIPPQVAASRFSL